MAMEIVIGKTEIGQGFALWEALALFGATAFGGLLSFLASRSFHRENLEEQRLQRQEEAYQANLSRVEENKASEENRIAQAQMLKDERETNLESKALMAWVKIRAMGTLLGKIKTDIDTRLEARVAEGRDMSEPSAFIENIVFGRGLPNEINASEVSFLLGEEGGAELFDEIRKFEDISHLIMDVVLKYNAERAIITTFLQEKSAQVDLKDGNIANFKLPDEAAGQYTVRSAVVSRLFGDLYSLLDDAVPEASDVLSKFHSMARKRFGGIFERTEVVFD